MSGPDHQHTANGTDFSAAAVPGAVRARPAVPGTMTATADGDLLFNAWTLCQPMGSLDRRPPGSPEPQAPHAQSPSQVKNHVAQALHETVLQTLVATTFLAESPRTSRQDLIEYLRRATRELHGFIEGLDSGHEPWLSPVPVTDCDSSSG